MNFDYHGVSVSQSTTIPSDILELATNIITDWMPATPNSLSRGFVDLLHNVIATDNINGSYQWTLKPTVAHFEKQWKQVTSWLLGVAFCKKVIDMEGYTWIAPVSAFTSQQRSLMQGTYWMPNIPLLNSSITYATPRVTTLRPDYVLARFTTGQFPFEISFAESKGTHKYLETLNTPPSSWINQARNAQFYFHNTKIAATQKMLIATRVNPKAKRVRTRRVYVRCWNSKNESLKACKEGFRDVVLLHYFGVCERIGLNANAKLIALRSYHDVNLYQKKERLALHRYIEENKESALREAKDEIEIYDTNRLMDGKILIAKNRSDFQVGERLIRAGLSYYGMDVIRWLQEGAEVNELTSILEQLQKGVSEIKSKLEDAKDMFIRSDGVITELIK